MYQVNPITEQYGNYAWPQEGYIECADKPGSDYTLAVDWQTDPMNPSVCWRLKTQTELDAESDSKIDADFINDKKFKVLALWIAQLHSITPADAKAQLKTIYKTV